MCFLASGMSGRDFQRPEDEAVFRRLTHRRISAAVARKLVVDGQFRGGPERGAPENLRRFLVVG